MKLSCSPGFLALLLALTLLGSPSVLLGWLSITHHNARLGATSALLMSPGCTGMHLSKFHENLCQLENGFSCPAVCQVLNTGKQQRCSKWFHTQRKWQTVFGTSCCMFPCWAVPLCMGRVSCLWAIMALIKIGNSGSLAGPKGSWVRCDCDRVSAEGCQPISSLF